MITASAIVKMTYPDFVGLIDQENTPPGAEYTIDDWIENGEITSQSHVLDLACSTGYSSQRLSRLTGCTGVGIDLSAISIERAQRRATAPQFRGKLRYEVGDATCLPFGDEIFSHIIGGSCFGFISSREDALIESARVCRKGGYLLTASWYYKKRPPADMLDSVSSVLGYRPSPDRDKQYWIDFFSKQFDQCNETNMELPEFDDSEIEIMVRRSLDRSEPVIAMPGDIKSAIFERLFYTRKVLRDHSRFQGLFVSAWKK